MKKVLIQVKRLLTEGVPKLDCSFNLYGEKDKLRSDQKLTKL